MKCDQDLCLNLRYDLKKLLWQDELNPRVRCAFGNVFLVPCAMFQLLKAIKLSNQWTPSARVCSMGSTANGRTLGQKSRRGKGKKAIIEFFALRRL